MYGMVWYGMVWYGMVWYQWSFQDPKLEVLYHIRPYFVVIFPYIGLIYALYMVGTSILGSWNSHWWYGMVWYGMVYGVWCMVYGVWCMVYGMVWYGVWYGMVYGMVWCMVWYGMVWYGMVWCMVWYGMVWYGMVWYGMVWYGMVWYVSHYVIMCIYIYYLGIYHTYTTKPSLKPAVFACPTTPQRHLGVQQPHHFFLDGGSTFQKNPPAPKVPRRFFCACVNR